MNEKLLRIIIARVPSLPTGLKERICRQAYEELREGPLFRIACDAIDRSIGQVAQKAGVPEVTLSQFANGSVGLGDSEKIRVLDALTQLRSDR